MCASLLGVGLMFLGHRVETTAAVMAYAREPNEATKRARDEAFATDERHRWRGVLFFGCCFAVSGAAFVLVMKRLDAHLTRRCS